MRHAIPGGPNVNPSEKKWRKKGALIALLVVLLACGGVLVVTRGVLDAVVAGYKGGRKILGEIVGLLHDIVRELRG